MLRHLPFVGIGLSVGLAAQQFTPEGGRAAAEIPPGRWSCIALADFDGDGDQDAAVNDPINNVFSVLRQDPGQTWTTINVQLPGVVSAAVWVDFDGDGDLDLLAGGTGTAAPAPFGILRNDGATFTWRGQSPSVLGGRIERFTVGDVDGDSLPDVAMGMATGVQMVRNLGNTTFGPASVMSTSPHARPALFDRDGDGDLDLVIAAPAGVALFDNALGVFTDISGTLPSAAAGVDVVGGDLDGDGRADLAFARGDTVDVAWNQANGWQLAVAVVAAGDAARELLCGDLDRDGDLDLIVRTQVAVDWLRNGGNRTFARLPALRHGAPWWVDAVALGDAGSRGADDIVAVFSDGQIRTLYALAPEPILDPQALPPPAGMTSGLSGSRLAVGDVDGDGRLDMVSPADREVLHDDGRGRFSRQPIAGAREGYQEAWLADLDGDGDLDLVLGSSNLTQPAPVPLQRLANDGLGHFTPVQDIAQLGSHRRFQFGDLDGDGDVDMLSPESSVIRVFQNVGNGVLLDSGFIPSAVAQVTNEIVFEDLDGDGDRDIVCGQINSALPVFLNDGSGVFTATGALPVTPGTYAWMVKGVDLDGDGALDIAISESGTPAWYRNNGAGAFTRVVGAFPAGNVYGLDFADIDDDGDMDVYIGGSPTALLTNDGTGVFTDATSRLWSTSFGWPHFADIDEDGDVDMVVLINGVGGWQRVHDRWRSAISLQFARPGGALQVRFHVQPHAPVSGALVVPIASIGPGPSTVVPGFRGKLLLPLAGVVMLGALDASSGTATTGIPVPPVLSLIGLDVCVQGIVLGPGVPLSFTNVVDERILP